MSPNKKKFNINIFTNLQVENSKEELIETNIKILQKR